MKFNLNEAPPKILRPFYGVEPGNVYRNQHGNFYVIITVFETRSEEQKASAFVLDKEGNITGCQCYICYYFNRLKLVGRALNMPSEIEIEWEE